MDGDVEYEQAIGTTWQHVKSGCIYTVVGVCVIEKTNEYAFLYKHGTSSAQAPWCRPVDEFLDGRFLIVE